MELFEKCSKFLSCSVNACPLENIPRYTDERDKEKICKLKPSEIKLIMAENRN